MIDLAILPVFFVATFFLVISPGPDLVLISTYASTRGLKPALMISLGIFAAGLIQTLLVAFGLGQLMQALPPLAMAIKILGALYLAWLGINLLKSWFQHTPTTVADTQVKNLNDWQLVQQGLLNNLMNPKALLFFSMFLPQFTHAESALTPQILILGVLLSTTALLINGLFSIMFSQLGKYLSGRFSLGHHIDGLLGVIFLGLAARLASSK